MRPRQIIVATSHALFNESLATLLADASPCQLSVVSVLSMDALLQAIRERGYDVIVLADPFSPLPLGYICRSINDIRPGNRIVALTRQVNIFSPSYLFRNGIHAILPTDCNITELTLAVDCVGNGKIYLSDSLLEHLAAELCGSMELHCKLSDREAEVLVMIAKGYTSGAVAKLLNIDSRMVSLCKSGLKRRLNVSSVSELIQYALEHGLILNTKH